MLMAIVSLHLRNSYSGLGAGDTNQGSGGHVLVEREAGRWDAAVALLPHTGAGHEEV